MSFRELTNLAPHNAEGIEEGFNPTTRRPHRAINYDEGQYEEAPPTKKTKVGQEDNDDDVEHHEAQAQAQTVDEAGETNSTSISIDQEDVEISDAESEASTPATELMDDEDSLKADAPSSGSQRTGNQWTDSDSDSDDDDDYFQEPTTKFKALKDLLISWKPMRLHRVIGQTTDAELLSFYTNYLKTPPNKLCGYTSHIRYGSLVFKSPLNRPSLAYMYDTIARTWETILRLALTSTLTLGNAHLFEPDEYFQSFEQDITIGLTHELRIHLKGSVTEIDRLSAPVLALAVKLLTKLYPFLAGVRRLSFFLCARRTNTDREVLRRETTILLRDTVSNLRALKAYIKGKVVKEDNGKFFETRGTGVQNKHREMERVNVAMTRWATLKMQIPVIKPPAA